jgi:hypothetical protein
VREGLNLGLNCLVFPNVVVERLPAGEHASGLSFFMPDNEWAVRA